MYLAIRFRPQDGISLEDLKLSLVDSESYGIFIDREFEDFLLASDFLLSYSSTAIEEALHGSVVIEIALAAHAAHRLHFRQFRLVFIRRVCRATIRIMHRARFGMPHHQCLLQCTEHHVTIILGRCDPADDAARA